MGWTYTDPSTQLSFGMLIQRFFTTLDPGSSGHYTPQNNWVPSGDFRIKFEFSTTAATTQTIVAGNQVSTNSINININSSGVQFFAFVGGSLQTIILSSAFNDGKLHKGEAVYTGTTAELFIDGISQGTETWALAGTENIANIGRRVGISQFMDGVISDITLTDVTTPSNSESWKLDNGVEVTTEQSSSGNNILTSVNVVDGDKEFFTLNRAGTQWDGALGSTLVIA